MKQNGHDRNIVYLTIPLAILMAIACSAGLFFENTYSRETASYAAQGIGQDAVNLFIIVPMLLLSALLAYRGSRAGLFIWSGTLFYIAYAFTVYAFALHFNDFFIVYCMTFGLSFYSFVYFVYRSSNEDVVGWFDKKVPIKSTSVFLFIIAFLFYAIWLSEIIPAIVSHSTPASVIESGLLVNPVHVIDLSICLPALIIAGILLLKKNRIGYILAPALLIFCIFMALAVIGMLIVMKMKEQEVDLQLPIIFGIITAMSLVFLIRYARRLK